MWSDNESDLDLLGFLHLATAIESIVDNEALLPATIGVYGDWGSGKSSLLQMARAALAQKEGRLVLSFNGWLFEGYEDAKTALTGTILDELVEHKKLTAKGKELFLKLVRRLDKMRVAGVASRAALAYAAGGLPALGLSAGTDFATLSSEAWSKAKEVDPEKLGEFWKESDNEQNLRRGIREFRKDFEELIKETSINTLVVIIDDLDRCAPDTIIETLEAIKLFLFVPRTAFILGADERLVKYAVRRRFPELPGERVEVGRDYLEKLIQFPIRVPPLGRAEMETYIGLLLTRIAGLYPEEFEKIRHAVVNCEPSALLEVRLNHGVVQNILGKVSPDLADNLALAQRIAPVLANGLLGNPRQCKRFLNALMMRLGMAESRKVKLKQRVLAKLMLLEYFRPESFRKLAELQAEELGKPAELASAEKSHKPRPPIATADAKKKESDNVTDGSRSVGASVVFSGQKSSTQGARGGLLEPTRAEAMDAVSDELPNWLSDAWTVDWLRSEPTLADEDLRPYFFFARDTLGPLGGAAQRMSPRAQEILTELFHDSEAVRGNAIKKSAELNGADVSAVFEEIANKARREEDMGAANSAFRMAFDWVGAHQELFGQITALLDSLPEAELPMTAVIKLEKICSLAEQRQIAKKMMEKWAASSSNVPLKNAANARLKKMK
ncbi:KAP family P-loop NTPase fold protein [Corallococcus carmarthensis]|uniref:KAP family P-loop NTPase fold protein n=1 Tax=Corallococcus carmarthensis TaxID=2316728 RepID=UPI00148D619C|nr:P-loop NTPase fold protein [Corallococcus carmarthensis]NOK20039.1 hypothetical protein [Corallococcus carmarthensis]